MNELTTAQALAIASEMGFSITQNAIRLAAREGRLPAQRFGRDWAIQRSALINWLKIPANHQRGRRPTGMPSHAKGA